MKQKQEERRGIDEVGPPREYAFGHGGRRLDQAGPLTPFASAAETILYSRGWQAHYRQRGVLPSKWGHGGDALIPRSRKTPDPEGPLLNL
jgi:hypothetical protein